MRLKAFGFRLVLINVGQADRLLSVTGAFLRCFVQGTCLTWVDHAIGQSREDGFRSSEIVRPTTKWQALLMDSMMEFMQKPETNCRPSREQKGAMRRCSKENRVA
ncbi:hypothetical protein P170DRAFT_143317 [Aspergillus steynii IBT 23096]|uniref:Uncharacterized protein n=1 Tax=Aspergillus steynii IBT 23096 TaxID=1392250 RepID=A0A2I2GC20_9EURO|nr:uncharacterized protein P170DRAFT_143317 [Aspergillus steynii IBT 23096]PLB50405.1 hypothetical protein P170DRAFT_143317 [Aspergillus steynii IBT 23096]